MSRPPVNSNGVYRTSNATRSPRQRGDCVLRITLYIAETDAYKGVNETYEQYFNGTYPAHTTVGVRELLGGAAVAVDAIVAVE